MPPPWTVTGTVPRSGCRSRSVNGLGVISAAENAENGARASRDDKARERSRGGERGGKREEGKRGAGKKRELTNGGKGSTRGEGKDLLAEREGPENLRKRFPLADSRWGSGYWQSKDELYAAAHPTPTQTEKLDLAMPIEIVSG